MAGVVAVLGDLVTALRDVFLEALRAFGFTADLRAATLRTGLRAIFLAGDFGAFLFVATLRLVDLAALRAFRFVARLTDLAFVPALRDFFLAADLADLNFETDFLDFAIGRLLLKCSTVGNTTSGHNPWCSSRNTARWNVELILAMQGRNCRLQGSGAGRWLDHAFYPSLNAEVNGL